MTSSLVETSAAPVDAGRPAGKSGWRQALSWTLRIAYVRLRFGIVLAAAFLIVGNWGTLRGLWDALWLQAATRPGAESSDTEYFCPMCPGVVSDIAVKCSICNMDLVRRRKHDAPQLPDGVVARMQLTPERLQLAGVKTVEVRPLPLRRKARGLARVLLPLEAPRQHRKRTDDAQSA